MTDKLAGDALIGTFARRLVNTAQRRAWWVIAAYALLAVIALRYTSSHLGINTDTEDMIAEDLPWRQTFIDYHQAFPQFVGNLLIVIDGLTPELAEKAQVQVAAALAEDEELFARIYTPGAGEFFDRHGLLYLTTTELQDLSDNLVQLQPILGTLAQNPTLTGLADVFSLIAKAPDDDFLLSLEKPLATFTKAFRYSAEGQYHPVSWQALLSSADPREMDRRRVVLVKPRRDFDQFLPGEAAINSVRALADTLQLDADHGLTLRLTGPVALEHEELKSIKQGATVAGFLALVMVSLVLVFAFRCWQLIAASLITLITGLIGTAAFAAFAVGNLNLISVAFAVLYIGLGIDFAIHFSLRYRELIGEGRGQADALSKTAGDVGGSLVLCALTTSVGFFAFYPTDFVGVSELGLISGVGMYVSLLTSLTLLPALLTIWPLTGKVKRPVIAIHWNPVTDRRYSGYIRVAAIVLGLLALTQVSQLRFDSNPLNLRDPETESVRVFEEMLSDKTATPMTLSILERDLAIAQEKAHKLNNLSEVEKAVTIKDLVPDDQTEKLFLVEDLALLLGPSLGERDERVPEIDYTAGFAAIDSLIGSLADLERVVSENEAGDVRALRLAAESFRTQLDAADNQEKMALTEHLATNLLEGLDQTLGKLRLALTAEAFDIEDLPEEVLSQWKTDDGRYRVAIYPSDDLANKESEEQFVTSVRAETPEATGVPVVEIEAGKAVVVAFRQAFSIALVIVFALLVMLMRNWLDPLLIVTPVLLAALLSVGIMAFLDIPLNFANIIALPLLFGIGVDNGIHIVHRFRVALPSSGNLMATSTARAVFFGTLTTIFSFGNLAFSSHVGMATMGKLLTIGMTLTMMTTLFVLPTLLRSRQEI